VTKDFRQILAAALVIALLNVISVCPVLAQQNSAAHSCCPQPSVPCSDNSSSHCPYVLLEKSKSEPSVLAWVLALAPAPATPAERIGAQCWSSVLSPASPYRDASESYLRFRVLLI
jgi:hypothetical protein